MPACGETQIQMNFHIGQQVRLTIEGRRMGLNKNLETGNERELGRVEHVDLERGLLTVRCPGEETDMVSLLKFWMPIGI